LNCVIDRQARLDVITAGTSGRYRDKDEEPKLTPAADAVAKEITQTVFRWRTQL
jgi:hypothetical protein